MYVKCETSHNNNMSSTGRIQDFKLGGGTYFKKSRRAEGGAKICGVFRVKSTILRNKIIFFPILGGPHPGSAPGQ